MSASVADAEALEFLGQLAAQEPESSTQAAVTPAYRGGEINRSNARWQPPQRSGDAAINEGWPTLHPRARDQGRNDPWLRGAKRRTTRRTVGWGIGVQSDVQVGDEPDTEFNEEADEAFERWSLEEADAGGRWNWPQMQRMLFSELREAGEAILLECADPDPARSVPLCYQIIESEQIADDLFLGSGAKLAQGHRVIRGIEVDEWYRPVAYYIRQPHPFGLDVFGMSAGGGSFEPQRIPAHRVIHLYDPDRPSATRGISGYAAVSGTAKDLEWLFGNELMKSYVSAIFVAAIKRKQANGSGVGVGDDDDGDGGVPANLLERLGRGILADLGPDDSVESIQSAVQSPQLGPFVKLVLMMMAAGLDMSYIGLTGDYASANFSAARAAGNDDWEQIEIWQEDFGLRPVLTVHRRFMIAAATAGRFKRVSAATFAKDPRRWCRATLHPPGRKQVDPDSETNAAIKRIFSGLSTWKDELARMGLDYRKVFKQLAREWKLLDKEGIKADMQNLALALGSTVVQSGRPADGKPKSPKDQEND